MTDEDETLQLSWLDPAVRLLRLNNPRRLNALTRDMVIALGQQLDAIAADDRCRVLVLTGAGRAFCAGQDVTEADARNRRGEESITEKLHWQERFAALPLKLHALPQVVIAAVNGPCVGIGLALALAADIRIATPSTRFMNAAIALGLTGGESGISYFLPRLIGAARAFEIVLSGRPIEADEADRIGLVAGLVDDDQLVAEARRRAEILVSRSPFGLRETKRLLHRNLNAPSLSAAMEAENSAQILAASTADYREGTAAFAERRPPRFTGK